MTSSRHPFLLLLLTLLLAACVPDVSQPQSVPVATPSPTPAPTPSPVPAPTPPVTSSAEIAVEATATSAWHKMRQEYDATGVYSPNALIDLNLPKGVMWSVQDLAEGYYLLAFRSDAVPNAAWYVSPTGVEKRSTVLSSG